MEGKDAEGEGMRGGGKGDIEGRGGWLQGGFHGNAVFLRFADGPASVTHTTALVAKMGTFVTFLGLNLAPSKNCNDTVKLQSP